VRPGFAGEHSRFPIAAQAASLLRRIFAAMAALPAEAMLRKALIRPAKTP
jgi:hypothetical protein